MRRKSLLFVCLTAILFMLLASCNSSKDVKITFDSQGGSRCKTITIDKDAPSIDLPEPTRDKYVFSGWYSDAELTERVNSPLPAEKYPTEDVTYYARWEEVVYIISFYAGDTKLGEKTYRYGEKVADGDYPSLAYYPSYRWDKKEYVVKSDGSIMAVRVVNPEEDKQTVFSIEYIVSGERYAYYTGKKGAEVATPADPSMSNNKYFYGWSLTENGETVDSLPTVIGSENLTYYAVFHSVPDSTDYLVYETMEENGVTGIRIIGLTTVGSYQQEIGIPAQIERKDVLAIGYNDDADEGGATKTISELRVFKSSTLTTVYLPTSLRTIGSWAFSDCPALSKVIFRGNNLSYIGRGAFAGCQSLSSFDLTDQVTVLGGYSFSGLTLTATGDKAPEKVVSGLPEKWQRETWYLKDMSLTDFSISSYSVLSQVGAYAFYRCVELTEMRLSSMLRQIDYLSFDESGITALSFYNGGSLRAVDGVVFSSNGAILYYYPICGQSEYTIPSGVTEIAENAFRDNKNLTSVTFSATVRVIGRNAFRGCGELTEALIYDGSALRSINNGAFADCPALSAISFPRSLATFGEERVEEGAIRVGVFENDVNLTRATFTGSNIGAITDRAFYGCVALTAIEIPESVKTIGNYAFYGCVELNSFVLRNIDYTNLASIGDYAFCDCTELAAVYLPRSIKYIGAYAFYGRTKKMKMELTNNDLADLECLGEGAFRNTSILGFTLHDKLISASEANEKYGKNYTLGAWAFADCTGLKTFGFSPTNAYSVVPEGFLYGCTSLTSISFTYNIRTLGAYAMSGCVALKDVAFNENSNAEQQIRSIGDYAFEGCKALRSGEGKTRLLPTSLETLGEGAFKNCLAITTVVIPERLAEIGREAFYGCRNLSLISYDRNVCLETFGENCFAYCTALTAVSLPATLGLKTAGKGFVKNPFFGCNSLASFSFNGITNGEKTANGLFVSEGVVYNQNRSDLYAFPTSKVGGPVAIESNVSVIEEYAFYGATLTELSFNGNNSPGSSGSIEVLLLTIGEAAFAESSLSKVTLSTRVSNVGKDAFLNCRSLATLLIDKDFIQNSAEYAIESTDDAVDNRLTIGERAFYHTKLSSLEVPYRVTEIGKEAFSCCYQLSEIAFVDERFSDLNPAPSSEKEKYPFYLSLKDCVFEGDTLLADITLPEWLSSLGEGVFRNCYNLGSVDFVAGNQGLSIGAYAFSDNHFLYEVYLPSNVKYMGKGVFSNDTRLKHFYFPEELTASDTLEISEEAFLNDTMLYSLTIPSYVTRIGERAYFGTHLSEVLFEGGAEPLSIGAYAFADAVNLESVSLPDNCVYIGEYAFSGSKKLSAFSYTNDLYTAEKMTPGIDYTIDDFVEDENDDNQTIACETAFFEAVWGYRAGETYYVVSRTDGNGLSAEGLYLYNSVRKGYTAFGEETQLGETYYTFRQASEIPGDKLFLYNSERERYVIIDVDRLLSGTMETVEAETLYLYDSVRKVYYVSGGQLEAGQTYYHFARAQSGTTEPLYIYSAENQGYIQYSDTPLSGMTYYTRMDVKEAFVRRFTPVLTEKYRENVSYYAVGKTGEEALSGNEDLFVTYRHNVIENEEMTEILYFVPAFDLTFGDGAFSDTSLKTVDINGRVIEMGKDVFADIQTLERARINGKFNAIPEGTFKNDKKLVEVMIGDAIDAIGKYAFYQSGLKKITRIYPLADEDLVIRDDDFIASLGSVGYSEALLEIKTVGDHAFYGSDITYFFVMETQEVTVGQSAFENCLSLSSVVIATTDNLICDDHSFGDCQNLSTLYLQSDTLSLGRGVAYNALSLSNGFRVVEKGEFPNYSMDQTEHVLYSYNLNTIVFYPAGKTGSFFELEGSIRHIAPYAFYGNKYLTGLRIFYEGSDVLELGENSLAETEGVTAFVAANLVSLYRNEWGTDDVQAYNAYLNGYVLTLQNSGKYFVTAYLGTSVSLTIPGAMTGGNVTYEITGIGKEAFKNNNDLVSVTIGAGIKTISNGAFSGCTSLREVSIGENVTGIKNYAFYGCISLTDLVFYGDSSVVSIGNYAFSGCSSLTSVQLPEKLETIGSYAFAGDKKLKSVSFSKEGLLEIKNNAFEGCVELRSVVLPSTVRTLGNYIFRNCNLVYVRCLSETVPLIEDKTFADVPAGIFYLVPGRSLNKYDVDSKWRSHIDKLISADYLYDGDVNEFKNYVLEPMQGNEYRLVAYLGDEEEVCIYPEISDSVKIASIGENAFGAFARHIIIEQGVKQIEANAFMYATSLEEVDLPSTLISIGAYAFAGLTDLHYVNISTRLYVAADDQAKMYSDSGVWSDMSESFYVLSDGKYRPATKSYSAENKYFVLDTLNYSLSTIGNYAFYNCTALKRFTFPMSLTSIGKYAFSCEDGKWMNLEEVVFNHSNTADQSIRFGEGAFANNRRLLNVTINCRVTYFGNAVFKNCVTLIYLYLRYMPVRVTEDMVVEVPSGADELFAGSEKLSVILPTENVLKLYKSKWESYAVKESDVNKLTTEVYCDDSDNDGVYDYVYSYVNRQGTRPTLTFVSYLGDSTEVVIPYEVSLNGKTCDVIRIGRENLAGMNEHNCSVISDNVVSVIIPETVQTIGADAFRNSRSLKTVTVQGSGLRGIEAYAFYGCANLETVTLPNTLSSIADYAFAECTSLNGYIEGNDDETGFFIQDVKDYSKNESISLGIGVFSGCTGMTFFRMPSQLSVIGSYTFDGCVNLSSIRYDNDYYLEGDEVLGQGDVTLNKIGSYAFRRTALSEIILPETVSTVDQGAFAYCDLLLSVYLYRNPIKSGYSDVTSTYRNVFEGLENNNIKIYVPIGTVNNYKSKEGWSSKQVVSLRFYGDYAYEINGDSEELSSESTIMLSAYRGTETDLTIPDYIEIGNSIYPVTTIGSYFGTPNLERVIFSSESKVTNIKDHAFAGCVSLREIHLPGADKKGDEVEIGGYAFENCRSLTDVHLPLYLTYLSPYLFSNCTALEELTLPDTVGEDTGKNTIILQNGGIIGNALFNGCRALSRLRILFTYPINAKLNVYGSNVFTGAGRDVVGGLHIIVPTSNLSNFANNWRVGSGEDFSFYADTMLYGDYLMESYTDSKGNEGYLLVQYRGNVNVVTLDADFSGKEILSVSDDVFSDGFTARYKEYVLVAEGGEWTLLSYEGTDEPDLTDLTVLGRRVSSSSGRE